MALDFLATQEQWQNVFKILMESDFWLSILHGNTLLIKCDKTTHIFRHAGNQNIYTLPLCTLSAEVIVNTLPK